VAWVCPGFLVVVGVGLLLSACSGCVLWVGDGCFYGRRVLGVCLVDGGGFCLTASRCR